MRGTAAKTRRRILEAADELFYSEGVRAAGVDAIADRAGVTKRTLYYHFCSKDELITAYVEARDPATLNRLKEVMNGEDIAAGIRALFKLVGSAGADPRWKGCAFIRVIHELAGQPGHPACALARRHKRALERWFAERIDAAGIAQANERARELSILLDGAITQMLTHREPAYAEAATGAALASLGLDSRVKVRAPTEGWRKGFAPRPQRLRHPGA
jgi:AcrR family transcriptional regulator